MAVTETIPALLLLVCPYRPAWLSAVCDIALLAGFLSPSLDKGGILANLAILLSVKRQ